MMLFGCFLAGSWIVVICLCFLTKKEKKDVTDKTFQ